MVAVQVGEHFADGFAERGHQRLLGGLDDGDVDTALTGAGGHLQADPSGAHHGQRRPFGQNGIQRRSIVERTQIVDSGGIGSRYRGRREADPVASSSLS